MVKVGAALRAVNRAKDGMLMVGHRLDIVSVIVAMLQDAMFGVINCAISCLFISWVAALVVLIAAMRVLVGSHIAHVSVARIVVGLLGIIRVVEV